MRVLLVDDEEGNRRVVEFLLERMGHSVLVASDGIEALTILRNKRVPDLVITDLTMPRMNGRELIEYLRRTKKTSHVPIIVISGKDNGPETCDGWNPDIDKHIKKPYELSNLAETINHVDRT